MECFESTKQPVITVLDEGYLVEVTITSIDDEYVQLDARFGFLTMDHLNFSPLVRIFRLFSWFLTEPQRHGEIETVIGVFKT